jgi:uncharacterized membrane protein YkoI
MGRFLIIGLALAAGVAHAATAAPDHQLAKQARITPARAQAVALAARPGVVKDQELEKEAGGSGLRYSFDIDAKGRVYEVGVDAKTGQVLENAREGKHPD